MYRIDCHILQPSGLIAYDFCFRRKTNLLDLTLNDEITAKHSNGSFSRKKEMQMKNALTNSNIKLCKNVLVCLVHKHFGDEKPSLKNGGKLKWNQICKEYNEIGNGALEKENPNTLYAKWRNIVYRAKLMKDPHPLNDPSKPIISLEILKKHIDLMKSNFQNEMNITSQNDCKTHLELSTSNHSETNVNSSEENNRMSLSDVKKQFGIGL